MEKLSVPQVVQIASHPRSALQAAPAPTLPSSTGVFDGEHAVAGSALVRNSAIAAGNRQRRNSCSDVTPERSENGVVRTP